MTKSKSPARKTKSKSPARKTKTKSKSPARKTKTKSKSQAKFRFGVSDEKRINKKILKSDLKFEFDENTIKDQIVTVKRNPPNSASPTHIYEMVLKDLRNVYMKVFVDENFRITPNSSEQTPNLVYEYYVYLLKIKYLSLVSPNFVSPISGKLGLQNDQIVDIISGKVVDEKTPTIKVTDVVLQKSFKKLSDEFFVRHKKSIQPTTYGYIITGPTLADFKNLKSVSKLSDFVIQARFNAKNLWPITAQLACACYCMYIAGVNHNDMHIGNILIYEYEDPKNIEYDFSPNIAMQMKFSTNYIVKIYDFDRATMKCNVLPRDCENDLNRVAAGGMDNNVYELKDFMKVLCYIRTLYKDVLDMVLNNKDKPYFDILFLDHTGEKCFFFDASHNPVYESLERGGDGYRYFKGYNEIFHYIKAKLINSKLTKPDPNIHYDLYKISKDQIHTDIESYDNVLRR